MTGEALSASKGTVIGTTHGLLHQLRMTLLTELGTTEFQELRFVGRMNVVTGIAVRTEDRFVGIVLQEFPLCICVAAKADLVHPVLQHACYIRTMGIMTGIARGVRKRHVDVFLL